MCVLINVCYINLLFFIYQIKISWVTEEGKEATTTFRRELLTKFQKVFEKEKKDDEEREKMQKAVENAETVSSASPSLPLFLPLLPSFTALSLSLSHPPTCHSF